MCSRPKAPAPPAPIAPPQASKLPETNIFQNRKRIMQAGGIGLPNPSGVPTSSLNLGGTQLLGGAIGQTPGGNR